MAWEEVTKPKNEGGLGLRNLLELNKVGTLKLIWRFLSSKSLWADWVQHYIIRQSSYWAISNRSSQGSWIWKKVLKLRSQAKELHRLQPGNGKSTSFWYDNWSPLGRLIDIAGTRGSINLGIPLSSTLYHASQTLRQRHHRSPFLNDIIHATRSFAQAQMQHEDVHQWKAKDGSYIPRFSTKHTWALTRSRLPSATWSKGIWFKYHTPKFAFISWLALRDRLSTGSRLRAWTSGDTVKCSFCGCILETRQHLFFTCTYSGNIWRAVVGSLVQHNHIQDWETTIQLLTNGLATATTTFLFRYAFQATIYIIWRERNSRRHGGQPTSHLLISKTIDKTIRNRITTIWGLTSYTKLQDGLQVWFDSRNSPH